MRVVLDNRPADSGFGPPRQAEPASYLRIYPETPDEFRCLEWALLVSKGAVLESNVATDSGYVVNLMGKKGG